MKESRFDKTELNECIQRNLRALSSNVPGSCEKVFLNRDYPLWGLFNSLAPRLVLFRCNNTIAKVNGVIHV